MKARVLVTRPVEEAPEAEAMIRECGLVPVRAPALAIQEAKAVLPDPALFQGVIFSSANGVRAFHKINRNPDWFSRKLFAVGPHTAALARQTGWRAVYQGAGGTMRDLAALIQKTLEAPARLAHFRGEIVRDDPAVLLKETGLAVEGIILYQANPVPRLPADVVAALRRGEIQAVLFYSARSMSAFVSALRRDWPDADLRRTKALCIAHSVIEFPENLEWAEILVSPTPDQAGMKSLLLDMTRDAD